MNIIEPITASEARWFGENVPGVWKRQLVEGLFGGGFGNGFGNDDNCSNDNNNNKTKTTSRWSVEVHTPDTLLDAFKRLEADAVRRRLELFREVVLYHRKQ